MAGTDILYCSLTSIHGGAEEVLLKYMLACREIGHRPVLLVPEDGWLVEKSRKQGFDVRLHPFVPGARTGSPFLRVIPLCANVVRLASLFRAMKPAIVHSNTVGVAYHSAAAARMAGIPSVVHVHDTYRFPFASRAKGRLLSRLADATLAVSDSVRTELIGHCPWMAGTCRRLYNGWDLTDYDSVKRIDVRSVFGFPPGAFVIGNVAAMSKLKGQAEMIQAFARLLTKRPDARLLIVGGCQGFRMQREYERDVRDLVRKWNMQDRVAFAGWREDAVDLINSVDLIAHVPIQPDSLPTVLLHASALAKPIVASGIGGIPEIVIHNRTGLIVAPAQADELVAAVQRLAGDSSLSQALGQGARERFRTIFSWKQLRDGLSDVYRSVLGEAPLPRERSAGPRRTGTKDEHG